MAEIDCPTVAADKNIVEADLKRVRLTCDRALARADKTDAPYRGLSNAGFVYVYEFMRRRTPPVIPSLMRAFQCECPYCFAMMSNAL